MKSWIKDYYSHRYSEYGRLIEESRCTLKKEYDR